MHLVPLLPTLGIPELIIILTIVLIFFGVGKLPEIGAALGKSIRSFRDAQDSLEEVGSEDADEARELSSDADNSA